MSVRGIDKKPPIPSVPSNSFGTTPRLSIREQARSKNNPRRAVDSDANKPVKNNVKKNRSGASNKSNTSSKGGNVDVKA